MDKNGKETPNYVKLVTKSKKSWVVKLRERDIRFQKDELRGLVTTTRRKN